MNKKRLLVAGVGGLIVIGVFLYNSIDISNQTISYRLKVLGAGIYEYYSVTGQWPASAADLAKTSMALQLRYWEDDLQTGRVVVLWPRNLKPNPLDNGSRILAYFNGGLISTFGNWVCWGDSRTEYLPTEKLQTILKSANSESS